MGSRGNSDTLSAKDPNGSPSSIRSNVVVVGAGYVGLVTAACLAHLGHRIRTVDQDATRIASLRSGISPIVEPGLDGLIRTGLAEGRLSFEAELQDALPAADMVFVAVGTLDADGRWTDAHVRSVLASILAAESVPPLIVVRSTMRPGTMQRLQHLVAASARPTHLLLNPEFTREGSAVADFLAPHRIIVGVATEDPASVGEPIRQLFAGIDAPFLVVDHSSAELIKIGSNAFLAAKITFANELARLCFATGADMTRVREGIGLDPRIGPAFLQSGPGFGGSCLPSQVELLSAMSQELGLELMPAVLRSNREQPRRLVRDLLSELPTPDRVAVLGLAFKANTDDTRESPSLRLVEALREAGVAEIRAYDPEVRGLATHAWVRVFPDAYVAASGVEILVIATEWPEFRSLDWGRLAQVMRGREVFDARSIIAAEEASAFGFRVRSLERRYPQRANRPYHEELRHRPGTADSPSASQLPIGATFVSGDRLPDRALR